AVHGQARSARGRDHARSRIAVVPRLLPFPLQRHQGLGVDRLDLRHHQLRLLALDHLAHRVAVEHVDDVAAMGDLHRRRVGVAIHRDHFDAEALQFDRHFLAQFARTEQQDALGVRGQGRSDGRHGRHLNRGPCDASTMPVRFRPLPPLAAMGLAATLLVAACSAPPFTQLSGLMLDAELDEISGLAASHRHPDTLWMLNDGGNEARVYAVGHRGGKIATLDIAGVDNTDWEDIAAFELDGRHYLLVADTGDNGGLRKTLQLHVVPEPDT